jgi:hypothetical protein
MKVNAAALPALFRVPCSPPVLPHIQPAPIIGTKTYPTARTQAQHLIQSSGQASLYQQHIQPTCLAMSTIS